MIAFVITVPTLALMLPMTAVVLWAYWQCVKWLSVRVDRWWLKRADAIYDRSMAAARAERHAACPFCQAARAAGCSHCSGDPT